MPLTQVPDAVLLMQMEYAEIPGLALTFQQAQRLWGLSAELCERSLALLVGSGFLVTTRRGTYVRRGDSPERDDAVALDRASAESRHLDLSQS